MKDMIKKEFIFTDHANKRWLLRFKDVNLTKELSSLVYCTNEEIGVLKSTAAFKNVKKEKRSAFFFYKGENGSYLVSERKFQGNKKDYANVIVTVIDLLKEDSSLITREFRKKMMIEEYNLIELTKGSDVDIPDKNLSSSLDTKKASIDKMLTKVNSRDFFSHYFSIKYFEKNNLNTVLAETSFSKILRALNKAHSLSILIEKSKEVSSKEKRLRNQKVLKLSAIELEKNLMNQNCSLFDLEDDIMDSQYILLLNYLLNLKMNALDCLTGKTRNLTQAEYDSEVDILSFYIKNCLYKKNDICHENLLKYINYLIEFQSGQITKMEENRIPINKLYISRYEQDLRLFSRILNLCEQDESLEKINIYLNLYDLFLEKFDQHEVKQFYLKSFLMVESDVA